MIASVPGFASVHTGVLPLLDEFQRQHPHITLDVVLDDHSRDFNAEQIDLGIRIGLPKDSIEANGNISAHEKSEGGSWVNLQIMNTENNDLGCSGSIDGRLAIIGNCNNGAAAVYRLQSFGFRGLEAMIDAPPRRPRRASTVTVLGETIAIGSLPLYRPIYSPDAPRGLSDRHDTA